MSFGTWQLFGLRFSHCRTGVLVGLALAVVVSLPGLAADAYHKLTDAEIKARLAGMEISDEIHWTEQYMRDGTLKITQMGKARTGQWYVRDGLLCLADGKSEPECKEVWIAGRKVQFRFPGADIPFDAILRKPR
jgi:hypothetical protein